MSRDVLILRVTSFIIWDSIFTPTSVGACNLEKETFYPSEPMEKIEFESKAVVSIARYFTKKMIDETQHTFGWF